MCFLQSAPTRYISVLIVLIIAILSLFFPTTRVLADREEDFPLQIRGDIANETAFRLSQPNEFTKIKTVSRVNSTYDLNPNIRFRVGVRAWYDAVFDLENNFPENVEEEYETELSLREGFVDISRDNFYTRIGLQQIVWGEAPGVFITDVVNPKDFREFVLAEFEEIRIPVWAVDAMYSFGDLTLEGVWIPIVELDELPEKGSEFEFFRPPLPSDVKVLEERPKEPSRKLGNSEIGTRLSWLIEGWDLSFLYLYSFDNFPVFFRETSFDPTNFQPIVTFKPQATRVHILGATFTKSWESLVLKGEMAYTIDRFLQAEDPMDSDGVTKTNVFDYIIEADYAFSEFDVNAGLTGSLVSASGASISRDKVDTFLFVRGETDFNFFDRNLLANAFFIIELDQWDYRFSPELTYTINDHLDVAVGMDLFGGDRNTLYGQFHDNDRLSLILKYRF